MVPRKNSTVSQSPIGDKLPSNRVVYPQRGSAAFALTLLGLQSRFGGKLLRI